MDYSTFGHVNLLAVLIAAILKMALGAFWYSPKVFGEIWAQSILKKKLEDCHCSVWNYAGMFVMSFLMAWVIALLFRFLNIQNLAQGAVISFFLWLGFVVTTQFSGVLWRKDPAQGYLINILYELASILVMSVLLTFWR